MTLIFKKKKFIGLSPDFVVSALEIPAPNLIIEIYAKKKKLSYVKPEKFTGTLHLNFNEGSLRGIFEEEKMTSGIQQTEK